MDKLPALGTQIFEVLIPTFQVFVPTLQQNKTSILSIPRVEHTYGSHPRQKLDLYPPSSSPSSSPILIFFYGGGLTRGDKIMTLPFLTDPLVYHNLGSFFAKLGYTTIIPDYRRVNTTETGEDAVYPSGGEDVALVFKWLEDYLVSEGSEKRDVFLMGNSAGGVHISTFLLDERWEGQREKLVGEEVSGRLRGAILLSIPAHFDQALNDRLDILKAYYGSDEGCKKLSPLGLLKSAVEKGSKKDKTIPDVLAITAELDPVDEIIEPNEDFVGLWKKSWGSGLDYQVIPKHNHISPPWALETGDKEAEQWGVDVVKWMDGKRGKNST